MLGVTIRADIPLGMDMLACVWKNLVGVNLDPVTDLQDADEHTYSYIKKIEMVRLVINPFTPADLFSSSKAVNGKLHFSYLVLKGGGSPLLSLRISCEL